MTLGIKNNNPSNIRWSALNHWKGQIGQSKGFCRFVTVEHGVRALLYLLRKYCYMYGCNTIEKIITRFAPPNENHTSIYIDFISKIIKFPKDKSLNLDFYSDYQGTQLYLLCCAICMYESQYHLDFATYKRALKLLHDK